MTPTERQSLAEQLKANPLFDVLINELVQGAIDRLIHANTDLARLECQLRVQAVQAFRADCEASLRSTRAPKNAPA